MNIFKKIASYIYPIKLTEIPSDRSGSLEITLVNGKLVVDSENDNYSYGSLQKVLKKAYASYTTQNVPGTVGPLKD